VARVSDRLVSGGDPLERELVQLGRRLSYPTASARFAERVTSAVRASSARPRSSWLGQPAWIFGRPIRRALLLAVALLLVVAAVAAAIGFGLPGVRITFGGPSASPVVVPTRSPEPSALPGSTLGLGLPIDVADAQAHVDFDVLLPDDPRFGQPDAAYLLNGRLALVWGARSGLPDTVEPGVSLVISEFRGVMDPGYFEKVLNVRTTVTGVTVRGVEGYWITGDPHFFFYVDPSGTPVDDTHRLVGDTLLWSDGTVTYRVESSLGREATITLANAMR
jgi:hypothetical protein